MPPIRGRSRTSVDSNSRVMSPGSDDPSYQQKRDRNNLAVKKSREKAKNKTSEMERQVNEIKGKNKEMEQSIEHLRSDLEYLKKTFINCTGNPNGPTMMTEQLNTYLIQTGDYEVSEAVKFLVHKVEELNSLNNPQ